MIPGGAEKAPLTLVDTSIKRREMALSMSWSLGRYKGEKRDQSHAFSTPLQAIFLNASDEKRG